MPLDAPYVVNYGVDRVRFFLSIDENRSEFRYCAALRTSEAELI